MLANFHFLRPWWLLALLPAALLWWRLWRGTDPRGIWGQHIAPHILPHLLKKGNEGRAFRPMHLLALLWLLMVVALAGPAWRPVPQPFAESEAGVMVVLKVTPSMTSADVPPTRLERALQKLRDFLDVRAGAPTGLIVYSGTSHLVMPLTQDAEVLMLMTEGLGPDIMPVEGDVLAEALSQAEALLARSEQPGSILVMADSVAPSQMDRLGGKGRPSVPIQLLAVGPSGSVDASLKKTGSLLDAHVQPLTVDDKDVTALARRATGSLSSVAGNPSGLQMRDEGYFLLPLMALGLLAWARKGWSIR